MSSNVLGCNITDTAVHTWQPLQQLVIVNYVNSGQARICSRRDIPAACTVSLSAPCEVILSTGTWELENDDSNTSRYVINQRHMSMVTYGWPRF